MAAGGFREFVAGEILTEDLINDYLLQGVLVFAGTAARGSAIPSPVEGQFSFRTDDDVTEFYDGTDWVPLSAGAVSATFEYLVISGGGGGGRHFGGGGGAGGYLAGTVTTVTRDIYVSVGAGGAGGVTTNGNPGALGGQSIFYSIAPVGGGGGAGRDLTTVSKAGGSGGGGGGDGTGATLSGSLGQNIFGLGNLGGTGFNDAGNSAGAGGGGAGGVGGNASSNSGGARGNGAASSITGTSVTRAQGGGGASSATSGIGGGAASGVNGTANLAGGGGGGANSTNGGNGGSGVVIVKFPNTVTLDIPVGLTSSTATSGSDVIVTFTAGAGVVGVS